jgi:DNA polymerase III subunit gamma/tau
MLGTIDRGHVTRIVESLSREDGPGLLAQARELDRDAPDYDRVLVDLAALLQRIAIAQIVPEAAQQDEEFDAPTLIRLSQAMSAEDVQLYYQIALGGRRDLAMAPEPRLGFEMTLLRMLAFRPDSEGTAQREPRASAALSAPVASIGPVAPAAPGAPSAPVEAVEAAAPVGALGPLAPVAALTIDAGSWPAVVSAASLSGMTRQLALNCVPASFLQDVLNLRLDQTAAEWRTRASEEKLQQGLSKYLGRDIRIVFEISQATVATPTRQRVMAEQDKAVRATAAFEQDPAVKSLRDRFGAEVDAASVKPTN